MKGFLLISTPIESGWNRALEQLPTISNGFPVFMNPRVAPHATTDAEPHILLDMCPQLMIGHALDNLVVAIPRAGRNPLADPGRRHLLRPPPANKKVFTAIISRLASAGDPWLSLPRAYRPALTTPRLPPCTMRLPPLASRFQGLPERVCTRVCSRVFWRFSPMNIVNVAGGTGLLPLRCAALCPRRPAPPALRFPPRPPRELVKKYSSIP